MATVDKSMADRIIDGNGYYLDDPRVARVVEYTDEGGKLAYAIEYPFERGRYSPSPWVRNPRVLWEAK